MTRIPHSIITTFLSLIFPTATLTLSAQTDSIADQHLDEITATAKAPEVRVTADRTIYNLTSSAGADNGTLMDALSSIPGIDVSNEGTISLYGNQGATLVIDGQRTYLKVGNSPTICGHSRFYSQHYQPAHKLSAPKMMQAIRTGSSR